MDVAALVALVLVTYAVALIGIVVGLRWFRAAAKRKLNGKF